MEKDYQLRGLIYKESHCISGTCNCPPYSIKLTPVANLKMLQQQEVDPEVIKMIKQDIRRTFPKLIEFKGYTMFVN